MFFLFLKNIIYNETGYKNYSSELRPGLYDIECFGAQGGDSFPDNSKPHYGGRGSYVHAKIKVTYKNLPYNVVIGSKGSQYSKGLPDGGYPYNALPDSEPGGGDPFTLPIDGKSGGGGGSSRVILGNNLYIVAAGGSGASTYYDGAPGGGYNFSYYKHFLDERFVITSDLKYMTGNQNGSYLIPNAYPGSGGGGGFLCGIGGWQDPNPSSVGVSGTSFISNDPSIIFSEFIFYENNYSSKLRYGDGSVIISSEYICLDNCSNCENGETCTDCDSNHVLYQGKCELTSCPNGYIEKSKLCIPCNNGSVIQDNQCVDRCSEGYYLDSANARCNKCSENCLSCTNESTCLTCNSSFFLKENKCVSSCGDGYYQDNKTRNCIACSVPNCNKCTKDVDTCEICSNPFILFNNNCDLKQCPIKYFNDSNICHSCGHNCKKCSSVTECNECISINMYHDSKGNCKYIRTQSFDFILNLQPLCREIRKRKAS